MHSMWMHVLHQLLLGVPAFIAYALSAAALALTAPAQSTFVSTSG